MLLAFLTPEPGGSELVCELGKKYSTQVTHGKKSAVCYLGLLSKGFVCVALGACER